MEESALGKKAETKKPKEPTETQYRSAMFTLALSYCPQINPCKECGWPVIHGFCCTYCGTGRP